MSTEKMREDFEKWECDSDQGPQTDPVWLMYDANTKSYPLDKIQSRWEAWQASRAAIEVDLREAYQKGWDESGEGWNAEYPGDCHLKESWQHQRDESLGLKVKP